MEIVDFEGINAKRRRHRWTIGLGAVLLVGIIFTIVHVLSLG